MLDAAFYDLTQEMGQAIATAMANLPPADAAPADPPPALKLRAGRAESPGWFLMQAAEFAPESLTVARLRVRDIYASERLVLAMLEIMASEQWLDRAGEEYSLTATGQALINRSRERIHRRAAEVQLLSETDLHLLESLLSRLVTASLASPTPPSVWCLAHSRNRAPENTAPVVVKLLHYSADFNAFRDDAHMAAWGRFLQNGAAWEAFALLCTGEADSIETVYQHLAHRGHTRQDYTMALADVCERGWLEPVPERGAYTPTESGQEVWRDVERQTNTYFYAPWSCLSETEITTLHELFVAIQATSSS